MLPILPPVMYRSGKVESELRLQSVGMLCASGEGGGMGLLSGIDYNSQRVAHNLVILAHKLHNELCDDGNEGYISNEEDVCERLRKSLSIVTVHIVTKSMRMNESFATRDERLRLLHALPIVYGGYVGLSISNLLKAEVFDVQPTGLFQLLTVTVLILRTKEEQEEYFEVAAAEFKRMLSSGAANVTGWADLLMKAVYNYIIGFQVFDRTDKK